MDEKRFSYYIAASSAVDLEALPRNCLWGHSGAAPDHALSGSDD